MLKGKAVQPVRKWTANGANKRLVLHVRHASLSITTPVSLLTNEFDVRSLLHGQVNLTAVNQIYVLHEAMNGCKKSNDSFKTCFENDNIRYAYNVCDRSTERCTDKLRAVYPLNIFKIGGQIRH